MMKMNHWMLVTCSLALAFLTGCGGGGSSSAQATSSAIYGVVLDNPANPTKLYVANAYKNVIQSLTLSNNQVTTFAGVVGTAGTGNGINASATFYAPFGLAIDGSDLYVADTYNQGIRKISSGIVSTLAGTLGTPGSASGSTGATSSFNLPKNLISDGTHLYVVDAANHAIRKVVLSSGSTSVLAGYPGSYGSNDGSGSSANFNWPFGVALAGGDLYVTDSSNHTIRKVTTNGVVSTFTGVAGTSGATDTSAGMPKFNQPAGIVSDGTHLYVADYFNHTIRKIVISTAAVSTLAGSAGIAGSTDGIGSVARFNLPLGLALDTLNGQLYVTDQNSQTIRKVNTTTGAVTTVNATF